MYTYTWKKYLPVIRILLKRSATENQVLKVNRIDFEKATRVKKPVCSFSIEIARGRVTNINPPIPAKDLMEVLMEDEVTRKLIRDNQYAIKLGSDFELHVKNNNPVVEASAEKLADDTAIEKSTEA